MPGLPNKALETARWDVGEAAGSPASQSAQNVTISLILAPDGAALPPLSEISDEVHTRGQIVCFPRTFQQLRPDCAPDCSQSNIVGAGRSRIILVIILLALQHCKPT